MKNQIKRLKEILQQNKEDLLYLLILGLPTGICLIALSQCTSIAEVY